LSVKIYYGASSRDLAAKLADNLADDCAGAADPFVAAQVMVPNANLKQWLQLQIADRRGITANIEFPFFEKGLWQALCAVDPTPPGFGRDGAPRLQQLDRGLLQLAVLLWLRDRVDQTDEAVDPFRSYITGDTAHDRKLWQLSSRLSAILNDYIYHRPAWISAWKRNQPAPFGGNPRHAPIEAAQRALFQGILGPDSLRSRLERDTNCQYRLLVEYATEVFSRLRSPSRARSKQPLHIFGMSRISPIHAECLFRLGQFVDVNLYQFAVCCEFWEDMETTQQERFRRMRALRRDLDPAAAPDTETAAAQISTPERPELDIEPLENPLLQAWGHAGRETMVLLSDYEERWPQAQCETWWLPAGTTVPPEGSSMLNRLQYRIRSRQRGEPAVAPDPSLQVTACPSIYREVEGVYHSIIHNVLEDDTLKLTDIAVLVTDMDSYRPVIEYVFDGGGQIPYNLVDSTAAMESVYGQAVQALLTLAAGDFTRKDVFDVILNPCFLEGVRTTREDAQQWLAWADNLGIYREFGTSPIEHDDAPSPFTWDQGLRRLRLGRIMNPDGPPRPETDDPTGANSGQAFQDIVPYADMQSSDGRSVGQFSAIVEALHARLAPLRTGTFTIGQWHQMLIALCDRFLGIPLDRAAEAFVRRSLFSSLEQAQQFDRIGGVDTRMPLPMLRELVQSALVDIPGRKGTYLSKGVSVASLRPMRPIPFKIVYVLGMQEGKFPGSNETTTLDLRCAGRPQPGDISLPDANRYLFLETMLATEEKLYVSYVSHDLQKDQAFFPCSIVKQLSAYVNDALVTTRWDPVDLPLKGSSPTYLATDDGGLPEHDVLVNYSVPDRIEAMAEVSRVLADSRGGAVELPHGFSADRYTTAVDDILRAARIDFEIEEPAEAEATDNERVTIRELSKFLNNPFEAGVRRHLRIYDEAEDSRALAEDEPFFSTFPADWAFETQALKTYVQTFKYTGNPAEELALAAERTEVFIDNTYRHGQRASRFPDDTFGDLDRHAFAVRIAARTAGSKEVKQPLAGLLDEQRDRLLLSNVVFGASDTEDPCDWQRPALRLQIPITDRGAVEVDLSASLPFVWADRDSGVLCDALTITANTTVSSRDISHHVFPPFLFLMTAAAAGEIPEGSLFAIHVAHGKGIATFKYCAWAPADARQWLTQLIADYLGDGAMDLLPFGVLKFKALIQPWADEDFSDDDTETYPAELTVALEKDQAAGHPKYRATDVHPVAAPTVPADAFEKVRRRLGPIMLAAGSATGGRT